MAESLMVDAIAQLRNPTSSDAQIDALKHLKNESIGHAEKKEDLIRHGIIDALGQTLVGAAKSQGKRRERGTSAALDSRPEPPPWLEEDEIRMQSVLLLGSIAHGGAAFVAPIVAGSIIQILIAALIPSETHPKIIIACLRTLLYLAESSQSASPQSESLQKSTSLDILYSTNTIRVFAEILSQRSQSTAAQTQLSYTCQFISRTCLEEYQRVALARGGILDLLGARLASYHAHQRFFPVRLHPTLSAALPPPPSRQILQHILAAITCILHNSQYRIARLLWSPPMLDVFPLHKPENIGDHYLPNGQSGGGYVSPLEYTLPHMQPYQLRGENDRAFPALGSTQISAKTNGLADLMDTGSTSIEPGTESMTGSSGCESSLISWLFNTVRSEQGLCRLHAADLLVTMNIAGFLTRSRDRMLAILVLPLLLSMIDERSSTHDTSLGRTGLDSEARLIKEQAPMILTKLLLKKPDLQKTAVDAGALTKATQLLKQSFEPLETHPPSWFPKTSPFYVVTDAPASCKLGPGGLRADLVHLLNCRISALKLLAAIADKEDTYRKQLTESGAVIYVIDSLIPFKEDALAELETGYSSGKAKVQPALLGNSIDVLLAACDAALALSRSVGLLRTSLIDAGLSKPIYALLKHPSVSVVRAATDVVCNIILEFSPMREDLVEAGIIKTLCEHARSADSSMRLVSLWALKHLMTKLPPDLRLICFEELGAGWLVQIITGGSSTPRPAKGSQPLAMGAANAAGERIDILNAVDEPMDTTEDGFTKDSSTSTSSANDANLISDTILHSLLPPNDPEYSALASAYRRRLTAFKAIEDRDTASQAYADELKIQTQGLDVLRNMSYPPGAADMIDTIFQTLGSTNVFELVGSKLKWPPSHLLRHVTSTSTNGSTNGNTHGVVDPGSTAATNPSDFPPSPLELEASTRLLESAIQVLVHIGAGAPRHRQQLISQTSLLKLLLPLFAHQDGGVRVAAVWVAVNLTWVDDASDVLGARQRALELRKLGFEDALRGLEQGDPSKDVMERAHSAAEQMRSLIEEVGMGGRHR